MPLHTRAALHPPLNQFWECGVIDLSTLELGVALTGGSPGSRRTSLGILDVYLLIRSAHIVLVLGESNTSSLPQK